MKRFSVSLPCFFACLFLLTCLMLANQTFATGLAFDGRYLWYSSFTNKIYKLDPLAPNDPIVQFFDTNRLINGPGYVRWRDLTWDGSYLWGASWASGKWVGAIHDSRIYKIDPNDGSLISSFDAPFLGHANGMAWDGTNLWVGEEDDHIYEVDPTSGTVVSSFTVPPNGGNNNPRGLAWDGSSIWAGYQRDGVIKEHIITDGSVVSSFASPSIYEGGLTYDGEYLWSEKVTFLGDGREVALFSQINPLTGETIYNFELRTEPSPVPEPTTMLLFGTGLVGLAVARLRKKKK